MKKKKPSRQLFSGKATHSVTGEAEKQVAGRVEAQGNFHKNKVIYLSIPPADVSPAALFPLCPRRELSPQENGGVSLEEVVQTNVDALHRRRLTFEQFRVSPSSCVWVLSGKLIDSVAVLSASVSVFRVPQKARNLPQVMKYVLLVVLADLHGLGEGNSSTLLPLFFLLNLFFAGV